MPVNQPSFDTAVETSWDGVDLEEFEDFQEFASVHVWHNTESPEDVDDVELPVAHKEDGQLKLVYEALNSAHDLAENALSEENAEQVRNVLEDLRQEEFPDREPLDADENSVSLDYVKDISDDEVGECISEKVDNGTPQDQAIAICLSEAESGSIEPEKNIDTMNDEEREERKQEIFENQEEMKTADFQVTGKDVELVKESENMDGEVVVNVPIQALTEDRDGDFITEKGQETIIRQLKSGTVPLMLNHGIGSNPAMYDARDIVGQFVDGDNRNGTTIGTARMRKSKDGESLHADAKEIVDLLEQDMPIGFSVGFIPQDVEEMEEGGNKINDLDLMEVSAVGIPSNPDAVPQAMSSAVAVAKNAGYQKDEIVSKIESAFEENDIMTDETQKESEINEVEKSGQQKDESTEQETEKAEGDVSGQDILEFAASHYEGMDVADFSQPVDDQGGEYVGSVDLREVATLVAARLDVDAGTVLEALEQVEDMDTEDDEPEDEERTHDDEDEDDDEEEMSEEPEETDSQDKEDEEKQGSDHTEDDKSSESETLEKTVEEDNPPQKMSQDEENQEEKEVDQLAEIADEKGEYWS